MRITNNYIQRNALAQLQTNLRQISDAQRRVSTGLRIERASDDPIGAAQAMQARGSLRALEQYRRNVDTARSRATLEEGVLDRLTDLLVRAKELGIAQGSDTATADTRATTRAELDQLLRQAVQLGNTRFGDEYLFGGRWADAPPFSEAQGTLTPLYVSLDPGTGLPRPPTGVAQTEIAAGRYFPSSHDGNEVLVSTGVLAALRELSDALVDPSDPRGKIATALTSLDGAFHQVQGLIGEIGARTNQLEVAGANLDALEINLRTLKSSVEEVDLEKAVTELVGRQTSYQAAMLATSRVMGLTLADYLR